MAMTPQQALRFFRSVIRSGEPWTSHCDVAYEQAMAHITQPAQAVDVVGYCTHDEFAKLLKRKDEPDHNFAAIEVWNKSFLSCVPITRALAGEQAGWRPIATAPKDGTFVLLACPSGYTTTPWVFTTGRMCSDYKPGRWINHANDDLMDWGGRPAYWRPQPEFPVAGSPPAWCPKCATNQPHHTDPNSSGCLHLCDVCNSIVEY